MEPHLPQNNILGSRKLSALKVKTNGDVGRPVAKPPAASNRGVTASDMSSCVQKQDRDRKFIATKLNSNIPAQSIEQCEDAHVLSRSLSGWGSFESHRSPTDLRQTDPFIRLDIASSSKSDNFRRQDSSSRLDSAGRPDSSGYISGASVSSTPDRPLSALARGVKITEFKENKVNPEPIVLEDTDLILEDHLSTRKLVCTFEIWDIDSTVNLCSTNV